MVPDYNFKNLINEDLKRNDRYDKEREIINNYKIYANEALKKNDYYTAEKHLTKLIELDNQVDGHYMDRSLCNTNLLNFEKALSDAENALKMNVRSRMAVLRKTMALFYLKRYEESAKFCKKGLKMYPDAEEFLEAKKMIECELTPPEDPTERLIQKLKRRPDTHIIMQEPGFFEKLTVLQKNLNNMRLYAHDPKMRKVMKVIFDLPDNFDFGIKEEKNIDPQEAEIEKNKGNEEYKKRNFDPALNHYDKAISLNPNEPLFFSNKAACYIEMKKYKNALDCINKGLELFEKIQLVDDTKLSRLYSRKASVLIKLNLIEESIEFYKKALNLKKDEKIREELESAEKMLLKKQALLSESKNLFKEGKILYKNGDYEKALKLFESSLENDKSNKKTLLYKAICLIRKSDLNNALKCLDKILEISPNYVKAIAKKGLVHWRLAEYNSALKCFETGLKLDPENIDCKEGVKGINDYFSKKENIADLNAREKLKNIMDPEIQDILKDEELMKKIRKIQNNQKDPGNLKLMQDMKVNTAFVKLIQYGYFNFKD